MKSALRWLALLIFIGSIGYWLAAGANRGWTKTSIPITIHDEVTGIGGVTYQKKFVPGVELLAAVWVLAVALASASFLFRTKREPRTSNEKSTTN